MTEGEGFYTQPYALLYFKFLQYTTPILSHDTTREAPISLKEIYEGEGYSPSLSITQHKISYDPPSLGNPWIYHIYFYLDSHERGVLSLYNPSVPSPLNVTSFLSINIIRNPLAQVEFLGFYLLEITDKAQIFENMFSLVLSLCPLPSAPTIPRAFSFSPTLLSKVPHCPLASIKGTRRSTPKRRWVSYCTRGWVPFCTRG